MIRPYNDAVLMLQRLRFAEEVRDYKDLKLPAAKAPKPAELKMAKSLIEQLSSPFDPAVYEDNYAKALLKIINQKAKGKTVKAKKTAAPDKGKVVDLMAQLKASLQSRKRKTTTS
ncbi:putative DNA repair protein YkoV [compost metagenome]